MNYKHVVEVLQIEIGHILNTKREIENAYVSKKIAKADYDELKATYQNKLDSCRAVIDKLEKDPKVYLAQDPSAISSISFMGRSVTFTYEELEEFMNMKYIESKSVRTELIIATLRRINEIAQEKGIEYVRESFPEDIVEFDEKRGYVLMLDKVIKEKGHE